MQEITLFGNPILMVTGGKMINQFYQFLGVFPRVGDEKIDFI